MTDFSFSPSFNSVSILIYHKDVPIYFFLNHPSLNENVDNNLSVINCQISSNLFFYTTLLGELSSSSRFARIFYKLLIYLNNNLHSISYRKRLKCIFKSFYYYQNRIYLQIHDKIHQYDEWINRRWYVLIDLLLYCLCVSFFKQDIHSITCFSKTYSL